MRPVIAETGKYQDFSLLFCALLAQKLQGLYCNVFAVLNLRLEAESYFTFRLSIKIVAQYFGPDSQLSCVPNSTSESQDFVACYFLSSPFLASQSYEARSTLSGSDSCGARANKNKTAYIHYTIMLYTMGSPWIS